MTDIPIKSLDNILVYLETEQSQRDCILDDLAIARRWLSSIDKPTPGLTIQIVDGEGKEIDRFPKAEV